MKLGTVEAGQGEKTFGFFKTGETHGRFPVHIPLHIINGAQPGPGSSCSRVPAAWRSSPR